MSGLCKTSNFTLVTREDLVGSHIGETDEKTKAILESCRRGTLMVDEAYALRSDSGSRDFGKEALNAIMNNIEGDGTTTTDRACIILAGYEQQTKELLKMNPGLKSRITHTFIFDEYSAEELGKILIVMLEKKEYRISSVDEKKIIQLMRQSLSDRDTSQHNARLCCTIIEHYDRINSAILFRQLSRNPTGSAATFDLQIPAMREAIEHVASDLPLIG